MPLLLSLLISLLVACRGPYWEQTLPPAPVTGITELADTTARCRAKFHTLGCYNRQTGVIWIQAGLEPQLRLCVLNHERKHAQGYDHPHFNEPGYGIDCGDGTVMPGA